MLAGLMKAATNSTTTSSRVTIIHGQLRGRSLTAANLKVARRAWRPSRVASSRWVQAPPAAAAEDPPLQGVGGTVGGHRDAGPIVSAQLAHPPELPGHQPVRATPAGFPGPIPIPAYCWCIEPMAASSKTATNKQCLEAGSSAYKYT